MSRPTYDAAELARSLLAELPECERVELLAEIMCACRDLSHLVAARNLLSAAINDLIAQQYDEAPE